MASSSMFGGADRFGPGLTEVFTVVEKAASFGTAVSENGAHMFGHVPHVAPEAWFHIIFPALDQEAITVLENRLRRPIPIGYRQLLRVTNGLHLFSGQLALYGLRTDYSRKTSIRLPFDLGDPNVHERPRTADPSWFLFAFYKEDGSQGYIDPQDGRTYRGTRDMTQPRVNQWASLDDFLSGEVRRLQGLFDDRGHEIDSTRPTTPEPDIN